MSEKAKFYGFIQPRAGCLYDLDSQNWVQVGYGETYNLVREDTLKVIRALNRGGSDPVVYVISIRPHEEAKDKWTNWGDEGDEDIEAYEDGYVCDVCGKPAVFYDGAQDKFFCEECN